MVKENFDTDKFFSALQTENKKIERKQRRIDHKKAMIGTPNSQTKGVDSPLIKRISPKQELVNSGKRVMDMPTHFNSVELNEPQNGTKDKYQFASH